MAESMVYGNYTGGSGEVSKELFALRILGSSMAPEFSDGDHVVIDRSLRPVLGDYVAANSAGVTCFGRYVQRKNKRRETVAGLEVLAHGSPTLWADGASITIVGTMVEHRRFRRALPTQGEDHA